jgi:hypothetical protein
LLVILLRCPDGRCSVPARMCSRRLAPPPVGDGQNASRTGETTGATGRAAQGGRPTMRQLIYRGMHQSDDLASCHVRLLRRKGRHYPSPCRTVFELALARSRSTLTPSRKMT